MERQKNVIREKSYQFSLDVISLYKDLQSKMEFVISKQLLRSGTSIGANVEESMAAQSRKDFISKMSISSKEARESHYWLRLLRDSNMCQDLDVSKELNDCSEIVRILTAIVKTSQTKSDG